MEKKTKLQQMGELLTDIISDFGGSWRYLVFFFSFVAFWLLWNKYASIKFDEYPYSFLNLILGILASIQAPIIMMSQDRQIERDRRLLRKDYEMSKEIIIELKEINNQLQQQNGKEKTNEYTRKVIRTKEDLEK